VIRGRPNLAETVAAVHAWREARLEADFAELRAWVEAEGCDFSEWLDLMIRLDIESAFRDERLSRLRRRAAELAAMLAAFSAVLRHALVGPPAVDAVTVTTAPAVDLERDLRVTVGPWHSPAPPASATRTVGSRAA
jgi:hypothetical protein